jgi:hypothetical protein
MKKQKPTEDDPVVCPICHSPLVDLMCTNVDCEFDGSGRA